MSALRIRHIVILILLALGLWFGPRVFAQNTTDSAGTPLFLPLITKNDATPSGTATATTPPATATPTATPAPTQPMRPELHMIWTVGKNGSPDENFDVAGVINNEGNGGWTVFTAGHTCHSQDTSVNCADTVVKAINVYDRSNLRYMDFTNSGNNGYRCFKPGLLTGFDVNLMFIKPASGNAPDANTRGYVANWSALDTEAVLRAEIPGHNVTAQITGTLQSFADTDNNGTSDEARFQVDVYSSISCRSMPGRSGGAYTTPYGAAEAVIALHTDSVCRANDYEPAAMTYASLIPSAEYIEANCRAWSLQPSGQVAAAELDTSWLKNLNVITATATITN